MTEYTYSASEVIKFYPYLFESEAMRPYIEKSQTSLTFKTSKNTTELLNLNCLLKKKN